MGPLILLGSAASSYMTGSASSPMTARCPCRPGGTKADNAVRMRPEDPDDSMRSGRPLSLSRHPSSGPWKWGLLPVTGLHRFEWHRGGPAFRVGG